MKAPTIILASSSKDREKIFERAGIKFKIIISDFDEEELKKAHQTPIKLAEQLAKQKALNVKNKTEIEGEKAIIIAADTLVEFEGQIIGKASDEKEAFKILKKLNNTTHRLISAIAITQTFDDKIIIDSDVSSVSFIELSDNEIEHYITTREWEGRAGAYSINDKAALFIDKIKGSSSTVMGIPMQKLFLILKREFNYNLMQLGS